MCQILTNPQDSSEALLLLLSSEREVQTLRDGLVWIPEPTCGRALPQNFLGPALEHMSHVITHPGWDVGALFAQLGLAHMADAVFSEGSCRGSYGH